MRSLQSELTSSHFSMPVDFAIASPSIRKLPLLVNVTLLSDCGAKYAWC